MHHKTESSLGIYALSSTPPPLEGEIIRFHRVERYRLQSVARSLFILEGEKKGLENPHSYHRTCSCMHSRIGSLVGVNLSREHKKAYYTGLVTCGSVWSCPVCASKIQERRRLEIATAIDKAYTEGYKCVMVTLTFPHLAFNRLDDLLKRQAVALEKLREGNPWDKIKSKSGYLGLIRSLELTFGDNGYHPHTHELWIVSKECNVEWLHQKILGRWESACKRAGLLDNCNISDFRLRSVDVKDNASNSDYLAKQDDSRHWGADREIAKASTKEGKKSGVHPFQFLVQYSEGDESAGERWIEYTSAMKRKRQIFWSNGLKEWAGLKEKKDEEIVMEQTEEADLLAELNADQWKIVLKYNARSKILDLAETGGISAIFQWFEKHSLQWYIDDTGEFLEVS